MIWNSTSHSSFIIARVRCAHITGQSIAWNKQSPDLHFYSLQTWRANMQRVCRTYSTLISGHKGRSRLQQVIDWVGGPDFSGPLVMDECHKAKNFVPGKESQSTKVAAAVLALQQALPKARVVYCRCKPFAQVLDVLIQILNGGNVMNYCKTFLCHSPGSWELKVIYWRFMEFLQPLTKHSFVWVLVQHI